MCCGDKCAHDMNESEMKPAESAAESVEDSKEGQKQCCKDTGEPCACETEGKVDEE